MDKWNGRISVEAMPHLDQIVALLREVEAFSGGTESDLRVMASGFSERAIEPEEWIVREGERGGEIFLLLDGRCEVLAGDRVVGEVLAGQVFGEIASLTGGVRMASVRASEAVTVLAMSQAEFQRVLHSSPKLSESVCLSLAKYMA